MMMINNMIYSNNIINFWKGRYVVVMELAVNSSYLLRNSCADIFLQEIRRWACICG